MLRALKKKKKKKFTGWKIHDSNSKRIKKFYLELPNMLWDASSLVINGDWHYFPGVQRPERDFGHSHSSSATFKYEWSYTSSLHACLHGRARTNLPLPLETRRYAMWKSGISLSALENDELCKLRRFTACLEMGPRRQGGWIGLVGRDRDVLVYDYDDTSCTSLTSGVCVTTDNAKIRI